MDERRRCKACGEEFPATSEFFVTVTVKQKNRLVRRYLASECRPCRNKRFRPYYEANRNKLIARATESTRKARATPEGREKDRKWSRESARRRFADPVERAKATARDREWRKANPGAWKRFKHHQPAMKRMYTAKRHAAELQATPPWLSAEDRRKIETIYAIADYLTRKTGVPHDVDHYYPLRNLTCCGLHVPWNMRVIPAHKNQSKGNRLPI